MSVVTRRRRHHHHHQQHKQQRKGVVTVALSILFVVVGFIAVVVPTSSPLLQNVALMTMMTMMVEAIPTAELGETVDCHCDDDGKPCKVDGYVGSSVIYEDELVRVWNFTLGPGQMTSMHRHDYDYHFVAIKPTQLEVYGEDGSRLFDFRAGGVLGFRVNGDFLEPIGIELPWPVPRTHSAKNIGPDDYYEILYESKIPPTTTTAAASAATAGSATTSDEEEPDL